MTEKQLQKSIVEFLNLNGCNVWSVNAGLIKINTNQGSRMFKGAPTGHSDIQGLRKKDGRFIAIEVKLPKRKKYVTEAQQMFLEDIEMCGGIVGVATSEDEALKIVK